LPVYLLACLPALPACLPVCLPAYARLFVWPAWSTCLFSLACVRLSAPPALFCWRRAVKPRFARENRSLLKYIGERPRGERPRRIALAGRSTSWEMALTRVIEGENRREGGE